MNGQNGFFDPSGFATYFDSNRLDDAIQAYAERARFPRCNEWYKKISGRGENERATTRGVVYDLNGREGRAWFVNGEKCDLKRGPNWIIADGYLCKGSRGKIGVMILGSNFNQAYPIPAPKGLCSE